MGLAPAATIFMPSAIMAADRMVAVVVPSPARSLVLDAACGRGPGKGRGVWRCARALRRRLVRTHPTGASAAAWAAASHKTCG